MAEERKGQAIEKWDEVNGHPEPVVTIVAETPQETAMKDPRTLGSQMRGIEDMVEQNDNSFDGIINILPKNDDAERIEEAERAKESIHKKLKDCAKSIQEDVERRPHSICCDLERT